MGAFEDMLEFMDSQKQDSSRVCISYELMGNKLEIPADKIIVKIDSKEYPLSLLLLELHKIVKWKLIYKGK